MDRGNPAPSEEAAGGALTAEERSELERGAVLFRVMDASAAEWLRAEKRFQLYLEAGARLPWGDYTSKRLLDPGFNRHSLSLSLPMVIPIDRARQKTFLEIRPEAVWFTDNNDAPGAADRPAQDPLFFIELQLSRFWTSRFWASLGVQAQWGGETVVDGMPGGNRLDQSFDEGAPGYAINRNVALSATYGRIFGSANDARGGGLAPASAAGVLRSRFIP